MKICQWIMTVTLMGTLLACSGNSQKEESVKTYADAEKEFVESLNRNDSMQVVALGEKCMSLLKAGDVDEGLKNVYVVRQGEMQPLSGEDLDNQRARFKRFPVVSYELESLTFSTQGLNDLKYRVAFAEKDDKGYAPSLSLMFNPVKLDGQWYLCLKTPEQTGKDMQNPLLDNSPAPEDVSMTSAQ